MGCDIHLYVEKREDSRWVTCDSWETDPKYPEDRPTVPYEKMWYRDRHYDLFSILADVRNGRGFAGVKTGQGFVPILQPRGIPEDACPEYLSEVEGYGLDVHSHSWLTLREILQYDWQQTSRKTGIVSASGLEEWRRCGRPTSYSGGIWGQGVVIFEAATIPQAELKSYIETVRVPSAPSVLDDTGPEFRGCKKPYFSVEWDTTYAEVGERLLSTVVPRMAAQVSDWNDVRITFFFDN